MPEVFLRLALSAVGGTLLVVEAPELHFIELGQCLSQAAHLGGRQVAHVVLVAHLEKLSLPDHQPALRIALIVAAENAIEGCPRLVAFRPTTRWKTPPTATAKSLMILMWTGDAAMPTDAQMSRRALAPGSIASVGI